MTTKPNPKSLTLCLILVALGLARPCRANDDTPDALGKTFRDTPLPLPAPSDDPSMRLVRAGNKLFAIPRNYLWMAEKSRSGELTTPTVQVLFPDFVGLTKDTKQCFTNSNVPCYRDVISFVVLDEQPNVSADQQLHNLQLGTGLINPQPKTGPCGTVIYEEKAPPKPGYIGFIYVLKKVADDSEPTLLRCSAGDLPNPSCNATATFDGTSYHYKFDRKHLCEWDQIRPKIDELLRQFLVGSAS